MEMILELFSIWTREKHYPSYMMGNIFPFYTFLGVRQVEKLSPLLYALI